jgi:Mg/Co/Ni transporter MgtE
MKTDIQLSVKPDMIIEAVKAMKKKDREDFLEDLLAATSPEFLDSIEEARADYISGRVFEHQNVFGK